MSFGTNPETPHPAGQPITLYVKVMQEGEPVDNAEEARFEIWREDERAKNRGQIPKKVQRITKGLTATVKKDGRAESPR